MPKTPEYRLKYRLKHRLTGAAIIVGFAIIVISVLLKEPGIATNANSANHGDTQQTFILEIPALNQGQEPGKEPGKKHGNTETSVANSTPEGDNDAKPALLDPEIDILGSSVKIPTSTKETGGNIVLTKDKNPDSGTNSASPQSKPTKGATQTQPQDESSGDLSIDGSGWTVRVGTFSKIENVNTVSARLKSHGFDPQHTKVQTTLGAATRIWLGPYTKKKTAEKVGIRLKPITGEKGYVTKISF